MAHGGAAVAAASREELERRMEELRVHEEFDAIVADGRPGTAEKWENVGQIHPHPARRRLRRSKARVGALGRKHARAGCGRRLGRSREECVAEGTRRCRGQQGGA